MKIKHTALLSLAALSLSAHAAIPGSLDPECVVEQWSNSSTYPKVIDINFSDTMWPDTWMAETGRDCPSFDQGGYVNAIIDVPLYGGAEGLKYPVVFHNCTFANKLSYGGYAGATAAFCRQYYLGEKASGNQAAYMNNWTVAGHTNYIEDNITRNNKNVPEYGEAGFVQMCRDAAKDGVSMHGWMEIDHIPYVDRIQWAWSSTSWGRGIKCDIKIGSEDWKPLVWMGSERQKQGWTVFSDQGYFMENEIKASDVSLRWRVWDGEILGNPVQSDAFTQGVDPMAQRQAPRVHKLQIFGSPVTAEQADFARANMINDPGELSDLGQFGGGQTGSEYSEPAAVGVTAFPTAEGFGRYATGGRGGEVVKVTSLADDGTPGTLRWAFAQHDGKPITIVFEVSGQIALAEPLKVNRANWTLAGQTAPGEGIAITRNKVNLGGSSNFIVRNVRFRIGQKDLAGNIQAENALGAENCSNFIFDHCSFGWSVEENMNTADSHFLTVQHSIVHEGLYDAGHSKGARGYGCQWGGSPATYHHNLLAHNSSRTCRFNGARGQDNVVFIEYANNVNFNYGKEGNCYGGENTADIASYNGLNSAHECNFMGNYYKPGPASSASSVVFVNVSYARDGARSWGPSKWWVDGNYAQGFASANADNWTAMRDEHYTLAQIKAAERITPELAYYKYTVAATLGDYTPAKYMLESVQDAQTAYNYVLDHAGTVNRDLTERRVIEDTRSGQPKYQGGAFGKAGIIDLESQAEGFYDYSTDYTVPADTDGDGMPDEWESKAGLDPAKADQNRLNANGRTALEVYLNSLMGETDNMEFGQSSITEVIDRTDIHYTAGALTLPVTALGATVEVFGMDGRLYNVLRVDSTRMNLGYMPAEAIVRISGNTMAPVVLKIAR